MKKLIFVILLIITPSIAWSIEYPPGCDTPQEKTEWLYRAQELLRFQHNIFVKWHKEGLSVGEYNGTVPVDVGGGVSEPTAIAPAIKAKYPHENKLSKGHLKKFIDEEFEPRQQQISQEIGVQRALLKASKTYSIDVGEIELPEVTVGQQEIVIGR